MLVVAPLAIHAQEFNKSKLDQYFDVLEEADKFMGSVAISKNGEIIYSRSLGYMDLEDNVEANNESRYRIGSISKTFTAVLTLKAVEEGKLDLDETIDTYFPKIRNAEKITIRHLLTHRSGIHSFTENTDYLSWSREEKTQKKMMKIIKKGGSDFEPDTKAAYSNTNFVLLTYILESVFDLSYADLIDQYIAQPLDLKGTYLGKPIDPKDNEARSYTYKKEWQRSPETAISVPMGAGGVVSTATELVKFSDALFTGDLLEPGSLEKMKTLKDRYGMGLFQYPFYERSSYGHTGGIDGFSSMFGYFYEGDVSFSILSNGINYDINSIAIAMLSEVFDKPYELPTFSTYEIDTKELDQYTGVYACPEFPLKITISKVDDHLTGQATGQPSFPISPIDLHTFTFDRAGIKMIFDPEKGKMNFSQMGRKFAFSKE